MPNSAILREMTTKLATKPRAIEKQSTQIEESAGNVFADLGFLDADDRLAKARLAQTICDMIGAAKLTQQQAAERLGIDQPKVSALMRGKLRDFSTERYALFDRAQSRRGDHGPQAAARRQASRSRACRQVAPATIGVRRFWISLPAWQ